jgi:hypothetical protein
MFCGLLLLKCLKTQVPQIGLNYGRSTSIIIAKHHIAYSYACCALKMYEIAIAVGVVAAILIIGTQPPPLRKVKVDDDDPPTPPPAPTAAQDGAPAPRSTTPESLAAEQGEALFNKWKTRRTRARYTGDVLVLGALGIAILMMLRMDYNFDLLVYIEKWFPREAATLREMSHRIFHAAHAWFGSQSKAQD